jgi:hypothetical protein
MNKDFIVTNNILTIISNSITIVYIIFIIFVLTIQKLNYEYIV